MGGKHDFGLLGAGEVIVAAGHPVFGLPVPEMGMRKYRVELVPAAELWVHPGTLWGLMSWQQWLKMLP